MSTKYKILNPDSPYFITFSTVYWIDVFSRKEYKDIVLESMLFCKEKKGLQLFAYCIMTNHLHIICRAKEGNSLSGILRDFKKYTSTAIYSAIRKNNLESRKE